MFLKSGSIALVAAALTLAAVPRPASADCESDSDQLRPIADRIPMSTTKLLVQFDFQRIEKEIGEGDEIECLEALQHAQHLVRRALAYMQTQGTAAPTQQPPPQPK
jgi:hypothetical protein